MTLANEIARGKNASKNHRIAQHDKNKDKDTAMMWVCAFELAAKFIEQFATVEEAASALEWEAVKLERKWSQYPVKAPGEREYRSWGVQ